MGMSDARTGLQPGKPASSSDAAESTARAIRRMFSAVAPRYDFLNHFLSLGWDIAWRKATAKALRGVLEGDRIQESRISAAARATWPSSWNGYSAGKVFGTDFCHPMLVLARKKSRRRSTLFFEADALALPFPDGISGWRHACLRVSQSGQLPRALEEIRRVLKPQGSPGHSRVLGSPVAGIRTNVPVLLPPCTA